MFFLHHNQSRISSRLTDGRKLLLLLLLTLLLFVITFMQSVYNYINLKIKIYRSIILSMVLYGCETWSLTLREERRLRVFENRVLRRVCGPKRNRVAKGMEKAA